MPIRCRLSAILGERRIKMSELARQTGLAKGTILGLYHERVRKVDYSVLEKICKALDCQPGDLLVYVPDEDV